MAFLKLKKGQDRRIRQGHPWIYSNEVDSAVTPLKSLTPGEVVSVITHDEQLQGIAYVNPHSLILGRMLSRDPKATFDESFIRTKLQAALTLREQLFDKPYYRLIFSEADGLPGLVVDRFADDLVVQLNTAGMDSRQEMVIQALRAVLPKTKSILFRNDSSIRKHEQLASEIKPAYGKPPEEISLEENGVKFVAPLLKGQKTGWFYDHRLNRARLKEYVRGKKVLDVFSYLGGFGIQAAGFGAKQVDCIEASAVAGQFIERNAALNNVDDKVKVIVDDAFDAMKTLLQQKQTYDVVILDPPAFIKKAKDKKEGLIAYQRINELAVKLLVPQGILVSCSCSMHLNMEDLFLLLQRAAYRAESTLAVLERGHQGPDHPIHLAVPETDYLKAVFAVKSY